MLAIDLIPKVGINTLPDIERDELGYNPREAQKERRTRNPTQASLQYNFKTMWSTTHSCRWWSKTTTVPVIARWLDRRESAMEPKIFTVASLEPANGYWRNQSSNLGSMVQSRVYYLSLEAAEHNRRRGEHNTAILLQHHEGCPKRSTTIALLHSRADRSKTSVVQTRQLKISGPKSTKFEAAHTTTDGDSSKHCQGRASWEDHTPNRRSGRMRFWVRT